MKKTKILSLFIFIYFFIVFSFNAHAIVVVKRVTIVGDSCTELRMRSGQVYDVKILEINEFQVTYTKCPKKDDKILVVDKSAIYRITMAGGEVIYQYKKTEVFQTQPEPSKPVIDLLDKYTLQNKAEAEKRAKEKEEKLKQKKEEKERENSQNSPKDLAENQQMGEVKPKKIKKKKKKFSDFAIKGNILATTGFLLAIIGTLGYQSIPWFSVFGLGGYICTLLGLMEINRNPKKYSEDNRVIVVGLMFLQALVLLIGTYNFLS